MIERGTLDDLAAFAIVASECSFRRAADRLGVSTSALSHQIKRLEGRLGVRLLQRNSRSVATSEAGERLLQTLAPALEQIGAALGELSVERGSVSGTVRITATRESYEAVIRPVLAEFGKAHPAAAVEVLIDYEMRDIIADRLDAGIRIGEKLEQDMISVQVGPPLRMAVVAAPAYLSRHAAPRQPEDLQQHRCIGYRMRPDGGAMPWEFEGEGRAIAMQVGGPLTLNQPELALEAALDGLGVAYVMQDRAAPYLSSGRLVHLLADWSPAFPGFHLYYPSRRQVAPTLAAFIVLLRQRFERMEQNR